jgi:hypothetical protein
VLWVRSYWTADVVGVTRERAVPSSDTLWSSTGNLWLRRWEPAAHSPAQFLGRGWFYGNQPAAQTDHLGYLASRREAQRFLGVTYLDYTWSTPGRPFDGTREHVLQVPHWLLAALAGALPAGRFLSRRRRRRAARAAAGLCPGCGYDLRATPQRCPECGESPDGQTLSAKKYLPDGPVR